MTQMPEAVRKYMKKMIFQQTFHIESGPQKRWRQIDIEQGFTSCWSLLAPVVEAAECASKSVQVTATEPRWLIDLKQALAALQNEGEGEHD